MVTLLGENENPETIAKWAFWLGVFSFFTILPYLFCLVFGFYGIIRIKDYNLKKKCLYGILIGTAEAVALLFLMANLAY